MVQRLLAALAVASSLTAGADMVGAKDTAGPSMRARSDTVAIVSAGIDSTDIRILSDLAAVLDDDESLRILPVIGKNSVQNIADVLRQETIDIGIVQSDVLAFLGREQLRPGTERSVRYIAKLYDEELHVLARRDITSIADLAGKKVSIGTAGSATSITASQLLDGLGIKVEAVSLEPPVALEKVKSGEIAALIHVAAKPARLFGDLNREDGVHFLPVTLPAELRGTYQPSRLSIQDYPLLIGAGEAGRGRPIATAAVGMVMAVYNWPPETERSRKLSRFTETFIRRFSAFLAPPRDPRWREVDPAAPVPGWVRFRPAEAWLKDKVVGSGNSVYPLVGRSSRDQAASKNRQPLPDRQADPLFEQFLRWLRIQEAQKP